MAITNFSVQNAAVNLSGLFTDFASFTSFEGHHLMHRVGTDSRIDVVLTGTDCVTFVFGQWGVSVDGGAETTIGDASGHVVSASVFSGLSDMAHTVSMRAIGDAFVDQDSTDSTHCTWSVTGAAPAIGAASGFGTQRILSGNSYIAKDQNYTSTSNNGYTLYVSTAFAGPSLRFYATCSAVKIWTYGNLQKYRLYVDGVDQATVVSAGNSGQFGWLTIASGLDSAAEHLYEVILTTQNASYVYAVMTTGGTGLNTGKTPPARSLLAAYGDSIVAASAQGYPDTGSAFIQQLGLLKDWNVFNSGIAGSKVQDSGTTRTADITGLLPQADILFVLYGTNDAFAAGRTTTQLQADYTTMLNALTAGASNMVIYCLGILPRNDKTQAQIDPYNTAIQAAIAAASPNSKIHYVDTKAWNMASSAYTSGGSFDSTNFADGLHPNPTGYLFMRDKLESVLVASGRTGRASLALAGGMRLGI